MRVAVLGAGIQGACVALALAARGATVDLFDKEDEAITQASLHSEGKIHLGFVYANDATLATAGLLAQAALAFAPLLQRWTGGRLAALGVSSAFTYLVHRESLLGPDELERRYDAITGLIREASGRGGDYFGLDPAEPVQRLSRADFRAEFDDRRTAAAFRTPEIAVDPGAVADLLRRALRNTTGVRLRLGARVVAAADEGDSAKVESATAGQVEQDRYDHVVNALWGGRLVIDQTAAVPLLRPWSFRTKYFLRVPATRIAFRAPSTTIVLGPFGDVVKYASGDLFLSWYPVARRAFSTDVAPPCLDLADDAEAVLRKSIPGRLAELIPSVSEVDDHLAAAKVHGGMIYALGDTEVSDAESLFHQRSRVGPRSYGRYHSIDTGKYTLAPLFAEQLAGQIMTTG